MTYCAGQNNIASWRFSHDTPFEISTALFQNLESRLFDDNCERNTENATQEEEGVLLLASGSKHRATITISSQNNTGRMMRHSGPASRSRSTSPSSRSLVTPSRSRSQSGSTSGGGSPSSPFSVSQQTYYEGDRFWCRVVFTKCRVFLVGFFLGGFLAQSFTAALSLCVQNNHHHNDFPIPHLTLPYNGIPTMYRDAKQQQKQEREQQHQQATIPIETQPGNYSTIRDFDRQARVVIATKIHGPDFVSQLRQSLCLLKAAYNDRMLYDILVFTTIPLSDYDTTQLTEIVHPANIRIVTDKKTLQDQIKSMTRLQRMQLRNRCKVNSTDELYWWTRCCEDGATGICMSLAYTWQSEFRAKHLWTHEALKPYQTMMWFDSDAMATRVWDHDPVAAFKRNQLKILFAHFPQGKSAGVDLKEKIMQAFHNETLCILQLKDGHLFAKGGDCVKPQIPNIHGFFHVTDLDFFRSPEILNWFNILIGDSKFSRRWDDQLAVTIPAAMRAQDLSWEMEAVGVKNDVWHNQFMDGKYR